MGERAGKAAVRRTARKRDHGRCASRMRLPENSQGQVVAETGKVPLKSSPIVIRNGRGPHGIFAGGAFGFAGGG
jgi:hypothetical protein